MHVLCTPPKSESAVGALFEDFLKNAFLRDTFLSFFFIYLKDQRPFRQLENLWTNTENFSVLNYGSENNLERNFIIKIVYWNRPNKTTFQKKVFAVRFSKHTVEVGSNAFLLIFSKPHPGVKKRRSLWKIKEKSFRPVFGLLSCHHSLPTNQEVCCGLY